jgi:hypothetical protein
VERREWNELAGGVEPWLPPIYTNAHFAEQEKYCYELRLRGLSIRQIADRAKVEHPEWSLSATTVHRRIEGFIKAELQQPREQVLRMELDRLDRLQTVLAGIIEREHLTFFEGRAVRVKTGEDADGKPVYENVPDHGPVLAAIDRWFKLQDRRAKYLGLDAPVQVDATVTETTQADLEIADMIREAQAKAAADEAKLSAEDGT